MGIRSIGTTFNAINENRYVQERIFGVSFEICMYNMYCVFLCAFKMNSTTKKAAKMYEYSSSSFEGSNLNMEFIMSIHLLNEISVLKYRPVFFGVLFGK